MSLSSPSVCSPSAAVAFAGLSFEVVIEHTSLAGGSFGRCETKVEISETCEEAEWGRLVVSLQAKT